MSEHLRDLESKLGPLTRYGTDTMSHFQILDSICDIDRRNILELQLICRDVVESGARTRSEIDHLYSKLVMLLVLR